MTEKVSDITNPKYDENMEGREIHTSNIAEAETADLSSLSSSTMAAFQKKKRNQKNIIMEETYAENHSSTAAGTATVGNMVEKHHMSLSKNIQLSAPSPITLQRVVVNANPKDNVHIDNNNKTTAAAAAAGLEQVSLEQPGAALVVVPGVTTTITTNVIPVVPATNLIVKGYQKIGSKRKHPPKSEATGSGNNNQNNSTAATMDHTMIQSPAATAATVIASRQSQDDDDDEEEDSSIKNKQQQKHLGFEQVKALLEFVGKKAVQPSIDGGPNSVHDDVGDGSGRRETISHVLAPASSTLVTLEESESRSTNPSSDKTNHTTAMDDTMMIKTSKSREKLEPDQVKELFGFAGRKALLSVMGIPVIQQQGSSLYDSDSMDNIPVVQNLGSFQDADALVVEHGYSLSANTSVSTKFREEPPEQKNNFPSISWNANSNDYVESRLSSPLPPPPPPPPRPPRPPHELPSSLTNTSRRSLAIDEKSTPNKMSRSLSPSHQAAKLSTGGVSNSTMGELSRLLTMSRSMSPSQANMSSPTTKSSRLTMGELSSFLKMSITPMTGDGSHIDGSQSPMEAISKLMNLSRPPSPKPIGSPTNSDKWNTGRSRTELSENESIDSYDGYSANENMQQKRSFKKSKETSEVHKTRYSSVSKTFLSYPNNLPTPRSHAPTQRRVRGLDPDMAPVRVPVDAPDLREFDDKHDELRSEVSDEVLVDSWQDAIDEDKENLGSSDDERLGLKLNSDGTVEVANDPFDETNNPFAAYDENVNDVHASYPDENLDELNNTLDDVSVAMKSFESSNVLFPKSLAQTLLSKSLSRESSQIQHVLEKKVRTNPFESFSEEEDQKDTEKMSASTKNHLHHSTSSFSPENYPVPKTLPKSRTTTSSKTPSRKTPRMNIHKQPSDPTPLRERNDGMKDAKVAPHVQSENLKVKKAFGNLVREKVALFEKASCNEEGSIQSPSFLLKGPTTSQEKVKKHKKKSSATSFRAISDLNMQVKGITFPREIDMDDDIYVSDLDQSLRNFPVKQINAVAIDNISGLDPSLTHDGQDTITTRESLSKDAPVVDRFEYEVTKSKSSLKQRQSEVIPGTDGHITKNLADSLTDTFSLMQQGTHEETIFMEGMFSPEAIFSPCASSFPCADMLKHVYTEERTFSPKRITFYPTDAIDDQPTNTSKPVVASYPRASMSNYLPDETPRISNEAKMLQDADGFKSSTNSFAAGASSKSSHKPTKQKIKRTARAPRNAHIDKQKHFFSDNDSDSEWLPAQVDHSLDRRFVNEQDQANSPNNITAAESDDFDNQIDRYETIEEHSVKVQEKRLCTINEQSIIGSSLLARLLAFGHEAADLSPASKKDFESKLNVLSPSSRELLKKSMQTALIDKYTSSAEISETSTEIHDEDQKMQKKATSRASYESDYDNFTEQQRFSATEDRLLSSLDEEKYSHTSPKTTDSNPSHLCNKHGHSSSKSNDSHSNHMTNEGVEVKLLRNLSFSSSIADVVAISEKGNAGRDIERGLQNMTEVSMSRLERFLESTSQSHSEMKSVNLLKKTSDISKKMKTSDSETVSSKSMATGISGQSERKSDNSLMLKQLTAVLQSDSSTNSESESKDSILGQLRNYLQKAKNEEQNIDIERIQSFLSDSKTWDGTTKINPLNNMTSNDLRMLLQNGLRKSRSKSLCHSENVLESSKKNQIVDNVVTSQSTLSTALNSHDLSLSNTGTISLIKPIQSSKSQVKPSENELIDLTGIGSFEDLLNEDAVWLFDVSPKSLQADGRSELENLMELAARKLGFMVDMENDQPAEGGEEMDRAFDSILTYVSSKQESDKADEVDAENDLNNNEVDLGTYVDLSLNKESNGEVDGIFDQKEPTEVSSACGPSEDKYATHHDSSEVLDDILFKICEGTESIFCGSGFEVIPVAKNESKENLVFSSDDTKSKTFASGKKRSSDHDHTDKSVANNADFQKEKSVLSTVDGEVFDFVEKYYRSRPGGLEEFRRTLESSVRKNSESSFNDTNSIIAPTCRNSSGNSVAANSAISSTDNLSIVLLKMKRDIEEIKSGSASCPPIRDTIEAKNISDHSRPTRQDFLDVLCNATEDVICGTRSSSVAPVENRCDDKVVGATEDKVVLSDYSTEHPAPLSSQPSQTLSVMNLTLGSSQFSSQLKLSSSEIMRTPDATDQRLEHDEATSADVEDTKNSMYSSSLDSQQEQENHNFSDLKDHLLIPDLNAICSSVPSKLHEDGIESDDEQNIGHLSEVNSGSTIEIIHEEPTTNSNYHNDSPSVNTLCGLPPCPKGYGAPSPEMLSHGESKFRSIDCSYAQHVKQVSPNSQKHGSVDRHFGARQGFPRYPRPHPEHLHFKDDLSGEGPIMNIYETKTETRKAPCPENYVPSGEVPQGISPNQEVNRTIYLGEQIQQEETSKLMLSQQVKAESIDVVEENDAEIKSNNKSRESDRHQGLPIGAVNVEVVNENGPDDDHSVETLNSVEFEGRDGVVHEIESASRLGIAPLRVAGQSHINLSEAATNDSNEPNLAHQSDSVDDSGVNSELDGDFTILRATPCVGSSNHFPVFGNVETENSDKVVAEVESIDIVEENGGRDNADAIHVSQKNTHSFMVKRSHQSGQKCQCMDGESIDLADEYNCMDRSDVGTSCSNGQVSFDNADSISDEGKFEARQSEGNASTTSENADSAEDGGHRNLQMDCSSSNVDFAKDRRADVPFRDHVDSSSEGNSQYSSRRAGINAQGDGRRPETPIVVECVPLIEGKFVQDDTTSIMTSRDGSTDISCGSLQAAESVRRPVVAGFDAVEQREVPLLVTTRGKTLTKESTEYFACSSSCENVDVKRSMVHGHDRMFKNERNSFPSETQEAEAAHRFGSYVLKRESSSNFLPLNSVDPCCSKSSLGQLSTNVPAKSQLYKTESESSGGGKGSKSDLSKEDSEIGDGKETSCSNSVADKKDKPTGFNASVANNTSVPSDLPSDASSGNLLELQQESLSKLEDSHDGHIPDDSSEKSSRRLPRSPDPHQALLSESFTMKTTTMSNKMSNHGIVLSDTKYDRTRIPTEISVTRRSGATSQRRQVFHTDIPHEIELRSHRSARSLLQSVAGQLSALWQQDKEKPYEPSAEENIESSPREEGMMKLTLPEYLTEEDDGTDLLLALTRSETYSDVNAPPSYSVSGDASVVHASEPHVIIHLEDVQSAETEEFDNDNSSTGKDQSESFYGRLSERTRRAKRSAQEPRRQPELQSGVNQENIIDVTKMEVDEVNGFSELRSSNSLNNLQLHPKPPIAARTNVEQAESKMESIPPLLTITSSDVEPVDVEELLQRYDQIVKNMVVLDEDRLARVQAKKSLEFAEAERARRSAAMSQRRSSSAQRAPQRVVDNHPLTLMRSASFGSLPAVVSGSLESSTASQKVRNLRAQIDRALKSSAEVREAQQRLGEEMSSFKHRIQEHRMNSPPASPRIKHTLHSSEEQQGGSHHSNHKSRPIDRLRERHEKLARKTSHSPRVGSESAVNHSSHASSGTNMMMIHSSGSSSGSSSSSHIISNRQSNLDAVSSSRPMIISKEPSESMMMSMSIERVTSSSSTPLITNLLASVSSSRTREDDDKTGYNNDDKIPDLQGVDSDDLFMNYTGSEEEDDDDLARTQQIESILSELRTAESLSPRAAAATNTTTTTMR
jgi:hypothetical protein